MKRTGQESRGRRLVRWFQRHNPWHVISVALALTTTLFCALWIGSVVPVEQLPDWISAITPAGALIAAGFAARAAYGQLQEQRKEANQRERDRIARHARAVFFEDLPPSLLPNSGAAARGKLTVHNTGTEPITRVQAYVRTPDRFASLSLFGVLIPTGTKGAGVEGFDEALAQAVQPWINKEIPRRRGVATWGVHPYVLVLTFVDSEGRQWIKNGDTAMDIVPADRPLYEVFPHSPLTAEEQVGPECDTVS